MVTVTGRPKVKFIKGKSVRVCVCVCVCGKDEGAQRRNRSWFKYPPRGTVKGKRVCVSVCVCARVCVFLRARENAL